MTGWAKENCSPCYGIGSVDCKTCHRLGKCQIVVEPVMMALEVAAQKLQPALHASLDLGASDISFPLLARTPHDAKLGQAQSN